MNLKSVWQVSWQYAVAMFVVMVLFASCSPIRFLDEDEKLLDHVKVVSNQKQFSASDFRPFVKQEPNSRWFNLVKVPIVFLPQILRVVWRKFSVEWVKLPSSLIHR